MPRTFIALFFAVNTLLLTACSSIPQSSEEFRNNWTLSGKIGVTTPEERAAGFIRWKQQNGDFDIYVSGPLNAGSTHIQGNLETIKISQGGKTLSGVNPEQFIYKNLGWYFPIQNLPYWLQGKTAPYSPAESQQDGDYLTQIQQDNWQVDLSRHHGYYQVPQKIKISQGDWQFLFVAKNWEFN